MPEFFYLIASTFQTNQKMVLHPNFSAWWRLGRNQTFVAGWNPVIWQNLKGECVSSASLVVETCAVIGIIKQFSYLAGCL